MVINKGDEFIEIGTGLTYRIYHISKHGTQVLISSRRVLETDWILHTNPIPYEELQARMFKGRWVPNTSAARTLYLSKL